MPFTCYGNQVSFPVQYFSFQICVFAFLWTSLSSIFPINWKLAPQVQLYSDSALLRGVGNATQMELCLSHCFTSGGSWYVYVLLGMVQTHPWVQVLTVLLFCCKLPLLSVIITWISNFTRGYKMMIFFFKLSFLPHLLTGIWTLVLLLGYLMVISNVAIVETWCQSSSLWCQEYTFPGCRSGGLQQWMVFWCISLARLQPQTFSPAPP